MIASILAFNATRDVFDREPGQTDEEWVMHLCGAAKFLVEAARFPKMPTSVVRYEDLVRTPERVPDASPQAAGPLSAGRRALPRSPAARREQETAAGREAR